MENNFSIQKQFLVFKIIFIVSFTAIMLGLNEYKTDKKLLDSGRRLLTSSSNTADDNDMMYKDLLRKLNVEKSLSFDKDYIYLGKWESNNTFDQFEKKLGSFQIKKFSSENCPKSILVESNCFEVKISFFDGFTSDRELEITVNCHLRDNNSDTMFYSENITKNYTMKSAFDYPNLPLDSSSIIIKLFEINFENIQEGVLNRDQIILKNKYKGVKGRINFDKININFEASIDEYFSDQGLKEYDFTLIMTVLGLYKFWNTFHFFVNIANNSTLAKNTSLLMICHLVLENFYIMLKLFLIYIFDSENTSYSPFFIPCLIYLLIFSIFEGRIMIVVWQSKNPHLDPQELKRRFYSFITYFYIVLTFVLLNSDFISNNFYCLILIYLGAWIPQIILNYESGQAQLSSNFIWSMSSTKIFLPIYFRIYKGNFVLVSSSFGKSSLLILILLFQILVLNIQMKSGSRSILPTFLRKAPYNFYVEINDENRKNFDKECIICLENLCKLDIGESFKNENFFEKNKLSCYERIKSRFNKIFVFTNLRKEHMRTPCNHYFHSECLEAWLKNKLECPFCRTNVPPIE